ncbi:hypothetical protein [Spirosoma pomorum]
MSAPTGLNTADTGAFSYHYVLSEPAARRKMWYRISCLASSRKTVILTGPVTPDESVMNTTNAFWQT